MGIHVFEFCIFDGFYSGRSNFSMECAKTWKESFPRSFYQERRSERGKGVKRNENKIILSIIIFTTCEINLDLIYVCVM